ncbi:MAG: hypothetical protein ACHQUA_02365 [Microgenomates group bacterium]
MRELEPNPLWEELFPDGERRSLVQELVREVSKIEAVNLIVSVMRRVEGGFNLQTVYVLLNEDEQLEKIEEAYLNICSDDYKKNLLGHVGVITESNFSELRFNDPLLKYKPVYILWEDDSEVLSTSLTSQRNFNGFLN